MKKLCALVLFFCAGWAKAQLSAWSPLYLSWQPYSGGTVVSSGGGGAPTDAQYVTCASDGTLSAETVAGTGVCTALATPSSANLATAITDETGTGLAVFASNPTFTLFKVGNGATGGGCYDILEDTDNGSNKQTICGQDSLSADVTYRFISDVGTAYGSTAGTIAVSNDKYPGIGRNPRTTYASFSDLCSRGVQNVGTTTTSVGEGWYVVGAGTSSGLKATTITEDGDAPCIITMTTGSTSTGSVALAAGGDNLNTFQVEGGEIAEFRFYLPVTSGTAGDNYTFLAGFIDDSSGTGAADGMYVYYSEADTHWGCHIEGGGSITESVSTTTATAAAWHVARVEVNAAASSVAFFVDGSELSCSPKTGGNIPTGSTEGTTPMMKLRATAQCAATTTCTAVADYAYAYKPGLTR